LTEEDLRTLLVGGLDGDAAAYRVFLSRLAAHLRAFLRRRLHGAPQDVEDLVQEILLAVHNQRHTYDSAQPVTAWIHAIARYKSIDWLRRRSRTERFEDALNEDDELLSDRDTEAAEAFYDIARLLQLLPDRQRLPILHVKLRGESVSETAGRIGMSESAVKVGIHRGLRALAATIRGAR
jgi:RNA polymerase sigma-70 factor (ECF subfamily)